MLEVEDLVKHYTSGTGDTVRAIDGVSLSIESGELFALYGPSGSGKSTLLQLVATLLRPDRGKVLVAGRDVTSMSEREATRFRLKDLGMVEQVPVLLESMTALDNAAIKLLDDHTHWKRARTRVLPLLLNLGLGDRLTNRADQLSTGERQRLVIARALSTNPPLVLADEPTGSLDSRRSRAVLELLTDVCKSRGIAMLLVTHDPRAAAFATTVRTLRDGHLHDEPVDVAQF